MSNLPHKIASLRSQLMFIRDSIDLNRIIGINRSQILSAKLPSRVFGHIQKLTISNSAMGLSKIFEFLKSNDTDSLPRIIRALPPTQLNEKIEIELRKFGAKYGNISEIDDPASFLKKTLECFKEKETDSLREIREFRDKIGAHSQSGIENLEFPCHEKLEIIWWFCADFYYLISSDFHQIHTDSMERNTGAPFLDILKKLGVENPLFDFKERNA